MNVLVACSNPIKIKDEYFLDNLHSLLDGQIIVGKYLDSEDSKAKADELNYYFKHDATNIFDVSGGDLANGVLDYLDYPTIAVSKTVFHGYSDLTPVSNAIYTQAKRQSWYYQIKFSSYYPEILDDVLNNVNNLNVEFIQGETMAGVAIGGNIRCFLKLAGTKYLSDFRGRILVLEAHSTEKYQVATMLNQLIQMGVFDRIAGLVLGTFTRLEQNGDYHWLIETIRELCPKPIAVTKDIGHHQCSKGFVVGKYYQFDKNNIRD